MGGPGGTEAAGDAAGLGAGAASGGQAGGFLGETGAAGNEEHQGLPRRLFLRARGSWAPGPRRLPDWLEGLGHLGAAGSPEALHTPLPTFRRLPKGTSLQLGDLFADLGAELSSWPAENDEGALLWMNIQCFGRWLLWAPAGGLPAHTPPAAREATRRDVVLGRITLARAGRWDLAANTAQREAERRAGQRARSQLPSSLAGRALANETQRRLHKGEWRNAASLLQSRGIAPPMEDMRKDLAKKLKGGA